MILLFKKSAFLFLLASSIFMLRCKKDNSTNNNNNNNNNNNQQVSIVGKWKVVYFVSANIYAQGIGPNDTTYTSAHDETMTFTTDSIMGDTWYATRYDLRVHPPVFSVSDTTEDIYNRGYRRNGSEIYEIANGIVKDTTDILKLTDSELLLHYSIPPNYGFNDQYVYLTK